MKKRTKIILDSISTICIMATITIIAINIIPKTSKNNFFLLGDYYLSDYQKLTQNRHENYLIDAVNGMFVNPTFQSKDLLRLINRDSQKIANNQTYKVSDLVKSSQNIIISIGMNDIVSCFSYDQYFDKFNYDDKNVNLTLNILYSNVYQIIDELQVYNELVNILLLSYYCPFNYDYTMQEIFKVANENIQSLCSENNVQFLDVSLLGGELYLQSKYDYHLNELGKRKINDLIYAYYATQEQNSQYPNPD